MSLCDLCGNPMPPGEEMFKFHGHSGPCPKPAQSAEPEKPAEMTPEMREAIEEHLKIDYAGDYASEDVLVGMDRQRLIALVRRAQAEEAGMVRDHERSFLISCPWCAEPMKGEPISYQITHLIRHGDNFRAARDDKERGRT